MSIVNEFRRHEERVLDRLVDGELNETDRRQLLAALDDEPGAWRRCALAFLEAQTWGKEFSCLVSEPPAPAQVASRPTGSTARWWRLCLAAAASLLLAFVAGTRFPANRAMSSPEPEGDEWLVAESDPENGEASDAIDDPSLAESSLEQPTQSDPETITLAVADGGEEEQIELPVTSAAAGDDKLTSSGSSVPVALLQSLERAGLQVRRQQRYMPVELSDGRRLVVPIEEVEIHDPQVVQY